MYTHIPFLEDILLLCALIFPSSLVSLIPAKRPSFTRTQVNNIIVHLVLILFVVFLKKDLFLFVHFPPLSWYVIAPLAGIACIGSEYIIGSFQVFYKHGRFPKGFSVHSFYQGKIKPIDIFLIVALVVCEELILRQAFFTIVYGSFKLEIWLVIVLSSVIYGLNHMFFGPKIVPQKMVSGLIYASLFYFSGMSIIIPIIAHSVQNLTLLALSKTGEKNAKTAD